MHRVLPAIRPRPRAHARILVAAAFALVLVTAACGDDGTTTATPAGTNTPEPTQATPTRSPDPTATAEDIGLSWRACGRSFECATLRVPLDYEQPSGTQFDLALVRVPARLPDRRIGSLVMNPGGPGGSGIEFLRLAASSFSGEVRDRFDLVSFDPRGVGESTPIVCHDNLQPLVAADPSPDDQAEWDRLVEEYRRFAEACASRNAEMLPHVGTRNVARDLDRIREALGDEKLTYLGFSYGTILGAVYADLFPARIRAMVLDGAADISLDGAAMATQQAAGFERALDAFLADCRQTACDMAQGLDPGEVVDGLFRRVEQHPIPAQFADRPAGPGELMLGVAAALYNRGTWNFLETALASAGRGDGSIIITLADALLQRRPDGSYPNSQEMQAAVNCLDRRHPATTAEVVALATGAQSAWPHFGAAAATGELTCVFWPLPAQPLDVPSGEGASPILVVGTTRDPATPFEWAVAMADQLQSAVLLVHEGDGHTAYLEDNPCVDSAVDAYLLELVVPEDGARCE